MSERFNLFILGIYVLCAVYFEIDMMIYVLSVLLVFEGLTDWRLTTGLQKIRKITLESGLVTFQTKNRFNIDAMRALRVSVAVILTTTYVLLNQYQVDFLWFIPWFMGFAILGAGASSVCPMMLFLRWAGFK